MHNLVLSGGGIKGLIHLGALKALNEKNLLKNIKNYAGSSIGSFIALLLCIGYNYNDILVICFKIDFKKFYNIDNIFDFFENYNILSFKPLEKLLYLLIQTKFKKKNITFKELFNLTEKTLHINAININSSDIVTFNYINSPDINIVDACIASCSIPFIFPPKKINNNYYIDAFVREPFPIRIFEEDLNNTIGIFFDSPIEYQKYDISSFQKYIMKIFISFQANTLFKKSKICIILNPHINPVDFEISKKQKYDLVNYGYNYSKKYIEEYLKSNPETIENIIDNLLDNIFIDVINNCKKKF